MSCSRSTINRKATVCTRPADSPRRTLSHSSGEILYPTMPSSTRRAFAVRAARQIHCRGGTGRFPQITNNLALTGNNLQRRLENLGIVQGYRFSVRFLRSRGSRLPLFAPSLLFFLGLVIGHTKTNRLFGQVHYVPNGRFDRVVASQILIDCLRLGRRFHYNQRTCHLVFVTPDSLAGRPMWRGVCPSRYLIAALLKMRKHALRIHSALCASAKTQLFSNFQ